MNGVRAGFGRRTRGNAKAEGKWFSARFIRLRGGVERDESAQWMALFMQTGFCLDVVARPSLDEKARNDAGDAYMRPMNAMESIDGQERLVVSLYLQIRFRQKMM